MDWGNGSTVLRLFGRSDDNSNDDNEELLLHEEDNVQLLDGSSIQRHFSHHFDLNGWVARHGRR